MGILGDIGWGIFGAINQIQLKWNELTIPSSSHHSDSESQRTIFFAQADLDYLKSRILLHADTTEESLISKRIAFFVSPFEPWIPEDVLNSIRENFAESIRNMYGGAYKQYINAQLTSDNEDCQKIFSIPSDQERQNEISAYREIIDQRSCAHFSDLCDDAITLYHSELLEAAEHALSDQKSIQQQRDLEREKLLITRAKLTMIDDHLNLIP